jgi:hypothetical protein
MLAHVVTGFEMLRGKLQRIGATLGAAAVLSACSGAVEEPAVAELEDIDAMTEEDTEPPADVDGEDAEVDGDEQAADDPDEGTEPADDVTETAEGDPYAIPEDGIDEAYVERVLNAIAAVAQEATQLTLESPATGVPVAAERLLASAFSGNYAATQYIALASLSESEAMRASMRKPVGRANVTVTGLHIADQTCIVVDRLIEFAEVLEGPATSSSDTLLLQPKSQVSDPAGLNPTPWVISEGFQGPREKDGCP